MKEEALQSGREEEARSGGPGAEKSDSCLPLRLSSHGDWKRMETLKKPESKWKRGLSSHFLFGVRTDQLAHFPAPEGAVCHIWAETTLKSKGVQKRGPGSLEVPTGRSGQAPQLRLRP